MTNNQLRYVSLIGLFLVPFVPLIVSTSLFFPFIVGKAFVFRILVEIIFFSWLVLAIRDSSYRPKFSWVFLALSGFVFVMAIANFFAENPFKAFWSNFERMEGYITLLHLFAYFLVMGSLLKTQELWNKLISTSVFVSAIMSVYSFFQIAGKITINQGGVRVDGTLGNAAYLGIYMVFHIFFASILLFKFRKNWQRILLSVVMLSNLVVLYFTATRGAILGLLGGALITFIFLSFKSKKDSLIPNESDNKIKRFAVGGLIATVIIIGSFLLLKNNDFVKNSPVLSRFSSLSFSEIKSQGRYYVWPIALKGIKENPILGWGQEGFNFVFNKYYDPRMYNQEQWFDRAHNTYLDWFIAGGILGFAFYLSIIVATYFYIFKVKEDLMSRGEKAVLLGLLSAYLFNNFFVFDQTVSYISFFTLLAYIHSHSDTDPKNCLSWQKISEFFRKIIDNQKFRNFIEAFLVILLVLILYFVNFIPWRQNRNIMKVLQSGAEGKVLDPKDYKKPFSDYGMWFSESLEQVSQIAISVISNQSVPEETKQEIFNTVDSAFKKHLEKVPNDARYRLFYGSFLGRLGWYGRAVEQLEVARELSPTKQSIYFELASYKLLDNKKNEAVEMAKIAYELEPNYEEAKIVYGLTLMLSGRLLEANEIMKGISENKIIFDDRYLSTLVSLKQYSNAINIVKKRVEADPLNNQHMITLTAVYLQAGMRSEAIKTLEYLIQKEPSFKEQGEYYIDEIKAGRNP